MWSSPPSLLSPNLRCDMQSFTAAELLELWERGQGCDALERDLQLLAFAQTEADAETLAGYDLGLRDWLLLRLRRALFGSAIVAYTDCPHCCERLEMQLDARELQDEEPPPEPSMYHSPDGTRFRLPNTRDLLAIRHAGDESQAARWLLQRCRIDQAATDEISTEVDDSLLDEVDRGLGRIAAERSPRLALACAQCRNEWELAFDPGQLLWEELQARAAAVIGEVDRLAMAYGWSETEILALSQTRRSAYLERVH